MSRVGKLPIDLPPGVAVEIRENEVTVKGPKGELCRSFDPKMSIALEGGALVVSTGSRDGLGALHGLTRSLLANMVDGVSKGYEKLLEVVGVGYRAQKVGEKLVLQVGFTHPVEVSPASGISFSVEGTNRIKVAGIDKEAVGEAAAKIRAIRRCDSYKGKGVKYVGETLRLKAGKAGRAAAKKK
ncbi:MAG: 50S ribosomal protein L6 [Chloroflexi bacterium]|nr:50S ribosomal protein L6 [Chloroflexota bacterium]